MCDTLRGCLAQCEDSDSSDIRALAYSQKTWIDLFDIFLKTSESRKPKPLRLLLVALERNLVKSPSQLVKRELVAYVTSKTWQAISLKNGGDSAVKPCLQALRHFMCKHVIRAQDIVLTISRYSTANGADRTEAQITPILLDSSSNSWYVECSRRFLGKTLHWLRHPDVAPITGRLIGIFCSSLRVWFSSWGESASSGKVGHGNQPIWFSALKLSIETQPELLDLFSIHVFPEVVRQDHGSIADFAQALSSKHLQTSNIIACDTADLHINLLLLRTIKEKGAFHAIGKFRLGSVRLL